MSRIEKLFSGISTIFFEEEDVSTSEFEVLLGGASTLDYFVEKGILQFSGRDKIKLTFVGAIVANKKVIYILPKYVDRSTDNLQSSQSYYINIIKKYIEYSSRKSARKPVKESLEDISLLMRTFDSLDGYFQRFGVFKEELSSFTKDDRGKINWSKTIQDMIPVHVTSVADNGIHSPTSISETVFYPSPIHHSLTQEEGITSIIFRNVLTLLASIVSPLLDRSHPLCISMRQDSIISLLANLDERRPYYIRILAQKIPKEFGYRRTVLSSLLAFLRAEASILDGAIRNKAFAFGVKKFSLVWEDACVRAVGGERNSRQLAKIIWCPQVGTGGDYTSRIDAKISSKDGSNDKLVDAKYYVIGKPKAENLMNVEKFIPSHDIVKQFGYMLAYHLGTGTKLDAIDSVFICPSVAKRDYHYFGKIVFDRMSTEQDLNLAPIRPIGVYGINPKYLFDAYVEDRFLSDFTFFLDADHNIVNKIAVLRLRKNTYTVMMKKDEAGVRVIGDIKNSKIPWFDGNHAARIKMAAKDQGVTSIIDGMNRRHDRKEDSGFVIRTDTFIQSFEASRFLLGGDDERKRKSVEIHDVSIDPPTDAFNGNG